MMKNALWSAAFVMLLSPLAPAAFAETFGESVMAPGLLATLSSGEERRFLHSRQIPESDPSAAPPKGDYRRLEAQQEAPVALAVTPEGRIALRKDGRQVADFPKTAPHPVLLMFLENVMRSVAQETGGNPHYIRNRMRTALGAQEITGAEMAIAPFVDDPNRTRFGPFANLQITIRWTPGAPGELTELTAELPDAPERYRETFRAAPKE